MVENVFTCVCMRACVFVFMYIIRTITQYTKSIDEYYQSQKMSRHFIQTAADGEIACTLSFRHCFSNANLFCVFPDNLGKETWKGENEWDDSQVK